MKQDGKTEKNCADDGTDALSVSVFATGLSSALDKASPEFGTCHLGSFDRAGLRDLLERLLALGVREEAVEGTPSVLIQDPHRSHVVKLSRGRLQYASEADADNRQIMTLDPGQICERIAASSARPEPEGTNLPAAARRRSWLTMFLLVVLASIAIHAVLLFSGYYSGTRRVEIVPVTSPQRLSELRARYAGVFMSPAGAPRRVLALSEGGVARLYETKDVATPASYRLMESTTYRFADVFDTPAVILKSRKEIVDLVPSGALILRGEPLVPGSAGPELRRALLSGEGVGQ